MRQSLANTSAILILLCGNFSFAMPVGESDSLRRISGTTGTVVVQEIDYKTWFRAARAGDIEGIRSLTDMDTDISQVNEYGKTALGCAARGGHIKIVRLLLEKRKGVFSEKDLSNALDNAVRGGRINIVELFLERGINPNSDTLLNASKKGYAEIVKLLLEERKGFFSEEDLSNALDKAVEKDCLGVAELLLKNGAEPSTSSNMIIRLLKDDFSIDKKEFSKALNDAVLNGNIEILKFLLDKHENFFYASVSDCALSNAAINGHTEVVKFLLNRCSDLFDESVLSNALYDAASRGYTKIIRLLLNKGAEPSNYTLKIAVEKGYTEIVGLLLKNSGDLFEEKTLSQALSKAVEKGHKKIVELLLDHGGVNPNFQYWENVNISKYGPPILRSKRTAPMLISALEGGYADVAKLLLNKFATLFDESVLTDALNYAAEKGYTEIAKLLLDKGANPNGGVYALETAFKKEYMEMVTFLVKKNVRPSHFVLGLAAKNGHRKIVELLLDKWIDIFDEAILSYTLSNAVKGKDISIIELLLDKGADPDKTAPYGDTSVLSEAAQNGCTEIVRLFLKKGANPDIQDGRGYTALMYAAESGHIEVVKLLTENEIIDLILRGKNKSSMTDNALEGLVVHGGVDLNLRNGNGYTALTLAENKGHTDIARWLRNFVE